MIIRVFDSTGIDTIDTEYYSDKSWNDVFGLGQKILKANGTNENFFKPKGSEAWDGKRWLEFIAGL